MILVESKQWSGVELCGFTPQSIIIHLYQGSPEMVKGTRASGEIHQALASKLSNILRLRSAQVGFRPSPYEVL